jgi:DNA phosphorothioation-dependent restriction protein DptG
MSATKSESEQMNPVDTYNRLKKKVDDLRVKVAKDEGRADEITARMKKEFGCDTIEAARELLDKKAANLEELKEDLEDQLAAFNEKWGEQFA